VIAPSTLLGIIGLMQGGGATPSMPAKRWPDATVDIVIPALNEQDNIVRCLASVMRQTLRPRKIVIVDDGSSDATAARAAAFSDFHEVDVLVIKRVHSIGKTPTIRAQVRTLDCHVLFVLDADTVLDSDTYLEQTVRELYHNPSVASAEGRILPLRDIDRRAWDTSPEVRAFVEAFPSYAPEIRTTWVRRLAAAMTSISRDVLHRFVGRGIADDQRTIAETISSASGCAVAYRRVYLEALFDVPLLGDDLTNSEDIFVGLTMLDEGYRNTQLTDVCVRTRATVPFLFS
ncbi:MAG: glycosyltransferase, partial [Vicinamibacterales bacterium]